MTTEAELLETYAAPLLADPAPWRERYAAAAPWPHLVLTELLHPDVVARAYAQELPRGLHLPLTRSHRQAKAEVFGGFGPAAQAVLDFLEGPEVVRWLQAVTGVDALEPDPGHTWAGLHANPVGAFHSLHRDFTRHPVDGRWHRVNVLVYLNPEWPDELGGKLELWASGATEAGAVVRPCAPNVVVFESNDASIHGLPDPVAGPPGTVRISLNSFFYSHEAPAGRELEPLLRRARRPQDPWWIGVATRWEVVHGIQHRTPPAVRRAVRSLRAVLRLP